MLVAQLKGMVLAVAVCVVVTPLLHAATHYIVPAHLLFSAGMSVAVPLGAIVGRFAIRMREHRVRTMLIGVAFPTGMAFLPALGLLEDPTAGEAYVLAGILWVPTALATMILELWTRTSTGPEIPRCVLVNKTLL